MKTLKLTTLVTLLLGCSIAIAADWSNNSIGYRYAPSGSEPGVSDKVAKNVFTFTHVSGDSLGSNFFTIDLLKSGSNDPAAGGGSSAQEWYGFYQRNFSISAMTGNKSGYGFAKDLSLTARVDAGAKNTTFAPSPLKLQLGIAASMPVSAGFWDIGIAAYKENNHNGIAFPGKVPNSVSFKVAPALTSAWGIPAGPGTFGGFVSVVGPKGKDGFGFETKTETLARATYMFPVMGPKSALSAGFGVEYWSNKFGCDSSNPLSYVVKNSCTSTTPMLLVEYKL